MDVLIVDDNEINLEVLSSLVNSVPGHRAHAFADPVQSLSYCVRCEPDLYVVDYLMPEIDGIEFVKRVRALPGRGEVPILMVTAAGDRSVRQRALEAGATDFLAKPVDAQEFLVRMRNMLRLRSAYLSVTRRAESLAAEVANATEQVRANERDTLFALARAAEYRDPETGAHVIRMAHFARLISEQLGASAEEQELILRAAPLHDLGKIGTPDQILLKRGPLTTEERVVMQEHAAIGWRILKSHVSPVLQAGACIAHSHHEKFDGSGYPQRLAGEQIPVHGRIVAVADVLDALTSARPYKPAWTPEAAREYLERERGAHFDPACVDALLSRWPDALEIRQRYAD